MKQAYISLGSNLGDRLEYLHKALNILNAHRGIKQLKVSSYYETEPVGHLEQGKFINAVASLKTSLSSYDLLTFLQGIESSLERERTIRWGPRTIDLDLLFYDNLVLDSHILTLPHPRLTERAFVLIPLEEIAPNLVHPLTGMTISEHLRGRSDVKGVVKL